MPEPKVSPFPFSGEFIPGVTATSRNKQKVQIDISRTILEVQQVSKHVHISGFPLSEALRATQGEFPFTRTIRSCWR